MLKGIISLGIFILIAVVAWWTISSNEKSNDLAQQANEEHYVVAYMNDFEMTAMDATGTPGFTLKGTHMERFNHTNETRIQQPVFQLLQSNKQWKISADSAIVNDENETIQLNDNVVMQQLPAALDKEHTNKRFAEEVNNVESPEQTGTEITIRTPSLLIHTKKQIAETKARVTVTHGSSKIFSTGMVFNNISNEIKLSSNVHGSIISND